MSGHIDAARRFLATETTIGKRAYGWSGIEVRLWLAANYDGGFDQLMADLRMRATVVEVTEPQEVLWNILDRLDTEPNGPTRWQLFEEADALADRDPGCAIDLAAWRAGDSDGL